MLDDICERLGDQEVDAGFDRRRKALSRDVERVDSDRRPVGQRVDRGKQPARGQERGADRGDVSASALVCNLGEDTIETVRGMEYRLRACANAGGPGAALAPEAAYVAVGRLDQEPL